jgi:hypothetical protein
VGIIKVRVIHLSGVGESAVDQPIAEMERMSNPTVGLLAHPGIVDIRITAKASSKLMADEMIKKIELQIVALFPNDIFGYAEQTLADCLIDLSLRNNIIINIADHGLSGTWPNEFLKCENVSLASSDAPLDLQLLQQNQTKNGTALAFYCNYFELNMESHLEYAVNFKGNWMADSLIYNGPQANGTLWATNRAMDKIRRLLIN